MYNIDDNVVYSMIGVCRVAGIKKLDFGGETKKYYVLKPLNAENNTIYVPCDGSGARIQPLLTADEAKNIIAAADDNDSTPFCFDKDECMAIIKSGDRAKTLRILRELNKSQKNAAAERRKFHIAEENVLNTAKKLLCNEFSYVLNITPDQALKMML